MFTFGSQINPSLGRSDFSAILQGGQARAQGIARAGEIQGQSLAQLGAIAAKGIETYVQKQEQKKQQTAATDFVANVFKANPFLAKGLNLPVDQNGEIDKGALKEFVNVLGSPGQAIQVASGLDQMSRAQQAEEDRRKAAQVAAYLQQGGGNLPSPVNRGAFTSEQYGAGRLAYLQQAQAEANLGKTQAEAAAIRAGKPDKEATGAEKVYQLNLAAWEKKNGPADETQRAKLAVEALRASQPSQPSALEQANAARLVERAKAEEQGMAALKTSIYDSVPKWTDVKDQNRIARELVASGAAVSGPGAEVKLNLMKGVNAVFPGTFDTTPSEVLSANYKNMGLTASAKIKGQGAITNEERKRVDDTIARLGNTPEAAIYIMNFADAVADRELARASYLAALEKQGTELSRGDLTIKFYEDNPLENFMPSMTTPKKSSQSAAMSRVYQTLSGSNEGTSPLANPSATLDRVNGFLKTRGL
jgi:hypothetical protein